MEGKQAGTGKGRGREGRRRVPAFSPHLTSVHSPPDIRREDGDMMTGTTFVYLSPSTDTNLRTRQEVGTTLLFAICRFRFTPKRHHQPKAVYVASFLSVRTPNHLSSSAPYLCFVLLPLLHTVRTSRKQRTSSATLSPSTSFFVNLERGAPRSEQD
jgi:hypothetical protein